MRIEEETSAAESGLLADALYQALKRAEKAEESLDAFKNILNNLDLTACVTLPETGDILFLNDRIMQMFGIQDNSLCHIKAIERSVAEAKERTKLMLDATPICCQLMLDNFKTIDCNKAAVKLFGLKDEQEFMERFLEFFPARQPDGRRSDEKSAELIKKAMEEGSCIFEWTYKMPDGTLMPAEVTLSRVKYGHEYVLAAYTRDLRQYKSMVFEIERQNYLLYMVNRVSAILLESDLDSFKNDVYRAMGLMAEAVGADRMYIWKNYVQDGHLYCAQIYEWSEGADPQKDNKLAIEAKYSDIVPEWEKRLSQKKCISGIVREMSASEQAALSPQGILSILIMPVFLQSEFWGFIGFDDCHRERVFSGNEEMILNSANQLITTALIRNEMAQSVRAGSVRLKDALEKEQEASRAKSEFLSRVSHEMRTPMNAIIGMTKIGKDSSDTRRKDYAFDRIGDASTHLLGIINDVLDLSKIEVNKMELSSVSFDFKAMLQRVASFLHVQMAEKRHRFTLSYDGVPQHLIGDEQRLAQVITNLLANAVKFTPDEGDIHLSVSLIGETDGLCAFRVEIADSGIGIPPEQQERIFLAFEQAEGGIARRFGGTGLGLPISKRIVELMGGSIRVESVPGKGSKFIFTVHLMRAGESGGAQKALEAAAPGSMNKTGLFAGKKILLAEDIEINREILIALLDGTGILIDTAENGREALEMIAAAPDVYDLIFMDMQMPEMDGLTATRNIRDLPAIRGRSLPIIAMTANVYREDVENCLAAGMDDHIGKPLDINELFLKLRQYL